MRREEGGTALGNGRNARKNQGAEFEIMPYRWQAL